MATSTTFRMGRADLIKPSVCCGGDVFYVVHVLEDYREMRRPPRKDISAVAAEILLGLVTMVTGRKDNMVFKDHDGRPWVKAGDLSWAVSISHSRNVVSVALATRTNLSVGIDVEYRDASRPVAELASQISMPPATGIRAFYDGWCRYEALFKATGIVDPDQQRHLNPVTEISIEVPADFAGKLVVCPC